MLNLGLKNRFLEFQWRFLHKNWLAGKIVEVLGDTGKLNGLSFDLSNPYISTFLKSRFLFKTYESGTVRTLREYLDAELPVVEFGGCIGVVSCLTNRALTYPIEHVVVEAQPFLIETLQANRDYNNCQFQIIHGALAYGSREVDFWISPRYFIGNSLKEKDGWSPVKVPTVSLQDIVEQRRYDKITLIVDVEGAEIELVKNEIDLMSRVVKTLVIELHPAEWYAGKEATEDLKVKLKEAGFEQRFCVRNDYVFINTGLI